jgi:putative membrane protein
MIFHNFAYGMGGWGMFAMMLVWVALLVALIWLISSLVVQGRQETQPGARKILEQRYANGELSREEFQQMKKDLGD